MENTEGKEHRNGFLELLRCFPPEKIKSYSVAKTENKKYIEFKAKCIP